MNNITEYLSGSKPKCEMNVEEAMTSRIILSMMVCEIKAVLEALPAESVLNEDVASGRVKLLCALNGFIERGEAAPFTVEEDIANQLSEMDARIRVNSNKDSQQLRKDAGYE